MDLAKTVEKEIGLNDLVHPCPDCKNKKFACSFKCKEYKQYMTHLNLAYDKHIVQVVEQ